MDLGERSFRIREMLNHPVGKCDIDGFGWQRDRELIRRGEQ
jgi:hypothetical protein